MLVVLGLVALFGAPVFTNAASNDTSGCLRLLGSVACPAFEGAYINPSNLSNAFPFFSGVNSVATFDSAALTYFSDSSQYQQTQFVGKLGCSNATGVFIRWERTVLCSMWTNEVWSIQCQKLLDYQTYLESPKMVCQSTCQEYSLSENTIVDDQEYCPGPDLTNGYRQGNITKDFVQCTNWTTLATTNTSVCVLGQDNESNCGYGSSTSQLCNFCDPSAVNQTSPLDSCCYASNTNLGTCSYTLPALNSTTATNSSSAAGSTPTTLVNNASSKNQMTGSQRAGVIAGTIIGVSVVLALVLFAFWRRRRRVKQQKRPQLPSTKSSSQSSSSDTAFDASPRTASTMVMPGLRPQQMSEEKKAKRRSIVQTVLDIRNDRQKQIIQEEDGVLPHNDIHNNYLGLKEGSESEWGIADREKIDLGLAAPQDVFSDGGSPDIDDDNGGNQRKGTVLSSFKDENSSGGDLLFPGQIVTCIWPYSSDLSDEFNLQPGMRLRIHRIYDDAWGTGELVTYNNIRVGSRKAFPLVCVTCNSHASTDGTPSIMTDYAGV